MGNKQESVSQEESKHSPPARGFVFRKPPGRLASFNAQTRAPGGWGQALVEKQGIVQYLCTVILP